MTIHFGDSSSIATGKIVNSAYLVDRKNQSTDGGTATGGGHYQRDLNTIVFDSGMSISISSNSFTIPNAGTYIIEWSAPAYQVNQHTCRLRQTSMYSKMKPKSDRACVASKKATWSEFK